MAASRQFLDSFGFSWQVWEIAREGAPPDDATGERATLGSRGWLYFFCRGTTRVLTYSPANWQSLSWPELEDLCASAALLGADRGAASPLAGVLQLR